MSLPYSPPVLNNFIAHVLATIEYLLMCCVSFRKHVYMGAKTYIHRIAHYPHSIRTHVVYEQGNTTYVGCIVI